MTNSYYNATGNPAQYARGLSTPVRNEYGSIESGFDLLPSPQVLGSSTQNYATDTGTVNNLVCTLNSNVAAYTDGMELVIKVAYTNTSAVTVTPGALAIRSVVDQDGNALTSNAFKAGQIIILRYDLTNTRFQFVISSDAAAAASAASAAASAATAAAHVLYINPTFRTSNTILGNADAGKRIVITSGTFTQTFDTGALTAGWSILYKNQGTGEITIPASDGLTNWKMYSGEERIFSYDGSNLYSTVINPFYLQITSSITFTKPPGYQILEGIAWSGGASGERTGAATNSKGGSGGGAFPFTIPTSSLSATETITIGAGGAVVTGVSTGNSGGTTTFGSLISVTGGSPTYGGAVTSWESSDNGAAHKLGYGSASVTNTPTAGVWPGGTASNDGSQDGIQGIYGAGPGGSIAAAGTIRTAGTSIFGGDGGAASAAGNGTAGTAPGGGGGATQTGTQSGAGARGEMWLWGKA